MLGSFVGLAGNALRITMVLDTLYSFQLACRYILNALTALGWSPLVVVQLGGHFFAKIRHSHTCMVSFLQAVV